MGAVQFAGECVESDVTTTDVVTLPPAADAAQFLQHMLVDRVICLPVTD